MQQKNYIELLLKGLPHVTLHVDTWAKILLFELQMVLGCKSQESV